MSDRAPAQIVIYDCPEEKRVELRTFIESEFDFSEGFFGEIETYKPIELFTEYGYDEADLQAYDEVSRTVISKFPAVSFACWSDPKYEYEGMGVLYTPELGRYDGRFTEAGEVYILAREIRSERGMFDDRTVLRNLEKGAGLPWLDALDAMREAVHGT